MIGQEQVRQCPLCGATSVDYSVLAGGEAKCRACKWKGTTEQLIIADIEHIYGTRDGIGMALSNDMRRLFSNPAFGQDLVRFLVKWGFMQLTGDNKKDTQTAARYISSIASACLMSVIGEREKIEKGVVSGA